MYYDYQMQRQRRIQLLTIFAKCPILHVWQSFEYVNEIDEH